MGFLKDEHRPWTSLYINDPKRDTTVELVEIMIQERTKHDLKPSEVNLCDEGNEQGVWNLYRRLLETILQRWTWHLLSYAASTHTSFEFVDRFDLIELSRYCRLERRYDFSWYGNGPDGWVWRSRNRFSPHCSGQAAVAQTWSASWRFSWSELRRLNSLCSSQRK